MQKITITTEYIKLDQAMKLQNMVESGAFAKEEIASGKVKVNGEVETRRGRKLYPEDTLEYENECYVIDKKRV